MDENRPGTTTTTTTTMSSSARIPFIAGTWIGKGQIFRTSSGDKVAHYNERFVTNIIKTTPKAMILSWTQFTKHAESGEGMHAENGFLRIFLTANTNDNNNDNDSTNNGYRNAELLLSHPFGVNECYSNVKIWDDRLECEAMKEECFQRVESACGKRVTGIKRVYRIGEGGRCLCYDVFMGVEGGELRHHLHAELTREDDT